MELRTTRESNERNGRCGDKVNHRDIGRRPSRFEVIQSIDGCGLKPIDAECTRHVLKVSYTSAVENG